YARELALPALQLVGRSGDLLLRRLQPLARLRMLLAGSRRRLLGCARGFARVAGFLHGLAADPLELLGTQLRFRARALDRLGLRVELLLEPLALLVGD